MPCGGGGRANIDTEIQNVRTHPSRSAFLYLFPQAKVRNVETVLAPIWEGRIQSFSPEAGMGRRTFPAIIRF